MSKTKEHKYNNFKNIAGKQIRRQYFDFPLMVLFCVSFVVVFSEILKTLVKEEILFIDTMSKIKTDIWVLSILIIAVIILKLLNEFCFGEILCTLTANGIHYKSGFFSYDQIIGATYHYGGPTISFPACVTVTVSQKKCGNTEAVIYYAPIGLLRQLKKHNCNIITDFTLFTKESIFFIGAITLVAPIFIAFFD